MGDREAFLAAIAAAPMDETLRGVFADWLDEHDEPEEADRQRKWVASERWLREYVAKADCPDYDTVIAAVVGDHHKNSIPESDPDGYDGYYNSHTDNGWDDEIYLHFGGRDAHGEIPAEFWDHVAIVTGRVPPVRATRFSCSC